MIYIAFVLMIKTYSYGISKFFIDLYNSLDSLTQHILFKENFSKESDCTLFHWQNSKFYT